MNRKFLENHENNDLCSRGMGGIEREVGGEKVYLFRSNLGSKANRICRWGEWEQKK